MHIFFKIVTGRKLHAEDLTLEKVRADGAAAVFIGIGMPEPKRISIFDGLGVQNGFYTSKDFLPLVNKASKTGKRFIIVRMLKPEAMSC